jgi:hypothetical protein
MTQRSKILSVNTDKMIESRSYELSNSSRANSKKGLEYERPIDCEQDVSQHGYPVVQMQSEDVSANSHHGGTFCGNSSISRAGPSPVASLQSSTCPHHSTGKTTTQTTTHHPPQPQTGRKGDPRMHRAVQARLANPTITLLEALQLGGFDYSSDVNDANVVDSENVTLGQRKNQLSRRLRLATKHNPIAVASGSSRSKALSLIPVESLGSASMANTNVVMESHVAKLLADVAQASSSSGSKRRWVSGHESQQDPRAGVLHTSGIASHRTSGGDAISAKDHGTAAAAAAEHAPRDISSVSDLLSDTKEEQVAVVHSPDSPPSRPAAAAPANRTAVLVSAESSEKTRRRRKTCNAPNDVSAIASLQQTETTASMGPTLDQLALLLRNNNIVSETLAPRSSSTAAVPGTTTQYDLAVALLQTEQRASCTKSMLLAGYAPDVAQDEHSPSYMQVALTAWQLEGQRLQSLAKTCHAQSSSGHEVKKSSIQSSTRTSNGISAARDTADDTLKVTPDGRSSSTDCLADQCRHGHDDSEQHPHHHGAHHRVDMAPQVERADPSSSTTAITITSPDLECVNETNRHIHRLGGKCGHIPILHQPAGGLPHIDFVVGDQVECYQGIQALSQDLLWPSSFCCEDLSCPDSCKEDVIPPKPKDHEHKHAECIIGGDPKVFDLNELNLDGVEWNLDFANGDSLMGLFKLAEQ